jgi:hypothetical protein
MIPQRLEPVRHNFKKVTKTLTEFGLARIPSNPGRVRKQKTHNTTLLIDFEFDLSICLRPLSRSFCA